MIFLLKINIFSIRGRLGSVMLFMRNIGILIAYILGATLDFKQIPFICICFPIIFGFTFIWLPNTPLFNLQNGRLEVRSNIFSSIYNNHI